MQLTLGAGVLAEGRYSEARVSATPVDERVSQRETCHRGAPRSSHPATHGRLRASLEPSVTL